MKLKTNLLEDENSRTFKCSGRLVADQQLNALETHQKALTPLPLSLNLLNAANVSTAAPASSSSMLDVEGLLGLPPSLLQITEDQLPSTSFTPDPNTPFVSFSPPLDHDDYLWSLEDGEGVSDFFDTYDLGDLLQS